MKRSLYTKAIRVCAVFLALIISLVTLASCSSAIKPSAQDLKVVGTVGSYEVLYEELYYLTSAYRNGLESKYGKYESLDAEAAKAFDDELRELVYSNIITNYAILMICADNGLTLGDEGIEERVDAYVESVIENDFDGDKDAYAKSLESVALTDHYFRFVSSVDMLYSDLKLKLVEEGKIEDDEKALKTLIKDEFARTWHIMISNDEGESVEDNRKKAEEALSKYRDGSMSMYKLIGSSYNEDYSLTELDGFYFAKGSMDEDYEKAAFALEVGEVSEVVEAMATNTKGEAVSAFYVIQRLEIEDDYVESHFEDLKEKYFDSVIYSMLEKKREEISFLPNEYAKGLTLSQIGAEG